MEPVFHRAAIDTKVGEVRLISSDAGLCYLELPRADGRGFRGWLKRHAPGTRVVDAIAPNQAASEQLLEFLDGKRFEFDLPLDLRATAFQKLVYDALLAIPYGESRSYADIAAAIGRPSAVRAVGAANGANPIPFVIPCHRVIASDGQLQGYAGGLRLKARLLTMEGTSPDTDRLF
jgi:O-6-methylguanine DNA methyltransferase